VKLFLDMDGVLADFVDGACKAHDRPSPYIDQLAYGKFEMEKLWAINANEFWSKIDADPDFWINLKKTPEADILVERSIEWFGRESIAILSAPSMDPKCVPGKRRWMQKHYPRLAKNMIFTSAKEFLASNKNVLVDDKSSNVQHFIEAGGIGIQMPRLWNAQWHRSNHALGDVLQALAEIKTI
jgi:5'(3')-deoxyribonucleotidase